jgi:hypothetical protein
LHHVSIDVLRWAFFNLKKQAAPGVDGLTRADYAAARFGIILGTSRAAQSEPTELQDALQVCEPHLDLEGSIISAHANTDDPDKGLVWIACSPTPRRRQTPLSKRSRRRCRCPCTGYPLPGSKMLLAFNSAGLSNGKSSWPST